MVGLIHILISVFLALYFITALLWILAYIRRTPVHQVKLDPGMRVSVVVAARNEGHNLPGLLGSLLDQDYDGDIEVIVSDDYSEDNSVQVIQDHVQMFREKGLRLIVISCSSECPQGKKHALARAIAHAKGEIVLSTDADCRVPPQWISLMVSPFRSENVRFVAGYVVLEGGRTFLERFQSVEQSVLSFISCAAINSGLPFMSNGANLAFRRATFKEVGGYDYGESHPGGDDTFFMLSVHRRYPGSIRFMDDKRSAVASKPLSDTHGYLQQRKRHGSKVSGYEEAYIKLVGVLLMITNLFHFLCYPAIAFLPGPDGPVIRFLTVKLLLDMFIGFFAVRRFGSFKPILFVIPFTLLYPIYLIIVSLLMIISPGFEWKGRQYPDR